MNIIEASAISQEVEKDFWDNYITSAINLDERMDRSIDHLFYENVFCKFLKGKYKEDDRKVAEIYEEEIKTLGEKYLK
jgi:hypothetical protein